MGADLRWRRIKGPSSQQKQQQQHQQQHQQQQQQQQQQRQQQNECQQKQSEHKTEERQRHQRDQSEKEHQHQQCQLFSFRERQKSKLDDDGTKNVNNNSSNNNNIVNNDEKLRNCRTLGPTTTWTTTTTTTTTTTKSVKKIPSFRFCRKLFSSSSCFRLKLKLEALLFFHFFWLIASLTAGVISGQPTAGQNTHVNSQDDALRYLSKFGYLKQQQPRPQPQQQPSQPQLQQPRPRSRNAGKTFSNLKLDEEVGRQRDAVGEFQKMAGLPVTGVFDEATIAMMNMPRCGVKDKFASNSRQKRYLLQGSKWRNKDLTYKISQYLPNLTKSQVDKVIYSAFKVWGDHSGLTFTQKQEGKVHINILFVSGEHGDGEPFDGKGGTLAHAYFPMFGGDAHFDADEVWTIQSKTGINLFIVAAHEIGHSLGLLHTDVREALMAPFYRGYTPNFRLHQDDIQAIQRLYGPPTSPSHGGKEDWFYSSYGTRPTKTTTIANNINNNINNNNIPNGGVDICLDPRIDAMTRVADGSTFAFKDNHYWLVKDAGYAQGYPRRIADDWDGLPGDLDSALTWRDGRTFFFKGDSYWRFTEGKKMDKGYPKKISAGFAGLPDHIDAAFVWSGNGKTYFFKDGEYWRYGASTHGLVDPGYPKPLSVWEGLPTHINAAFQWKNGKTYFFAEDTYYRFNDKDLKVDSSFPRPVSSWWFGCSDISNSALVMPPSQEAAEEYLGKKEDHPWFWQQSQPAALTSDGHNSHLHIKVKNVFINARLLSILDGELGFLYFLLFHVITPFLLIRVIS